MVHYPSNIKNAYLRPFLMSCERQLEPNKTYMNKEQPFWKRWPSSFRHGSASPKHKKYVNILLVLILATEITF